MKSINTLKMVGLGGKFISRFHYQSIIEPHVEAQSNRPASSGGCEPEPHESPQWMVDAERWLKEDVEKKLARTMRPPGRATIFIPGNPKNNLFR
jgi:hypothetical protein